MRYKEHITQIFSRRGVAKLNAIKRCLCVLIIVAGIGTLGLISLPQKAQQKSWLLAASSFHSRFLDNLTKQNCVLFDEDGLDPDKDDFIVKDYKKFLELFLTANLKPLTYSLVNSHWEIFFDVRKSSPYISIFVSLPLRSPPLFS